MSFDTVSRSSGLRPAACYYYLKFMAWAEAAELGTLDVRMTDPVDEFGRIALHYAARDGDHLVATQLISAGADVNLRDAGGWTPLHFAAQAGAVRTVEALISAGAAVNSLDANGNTPLFRAVFAAKSDGSVIQALRAAGADPTLKNNAGVSPLILARRIGNYNVAQFFSDMPEPDV